MSRPPTWKSGATCSVRRGVIAGVLVIRYTRWTWVDPVIAVGIGLCVLPRTWILLKESLNILLQGLPQGIDLDKVTQAMTAVPGV